MEVATRTATLESWNCKAGIPNVVRLTFDDEMCG